jgi:Golgi phosphoprotein 3 (GPP34)
MGTPMDLLLLAIDPSGRTWFGPKLSYALPVAELIELAQSDRVGLQDGELIVRDNLAQHAAISQLSQRASQLASTDPRTFDERIGLTPEARRTAMWFDL